MIWTPLDKQFLTEDLFSLFFQKETIDLATISPISSKLINCSSVDSMKLFKSPSYFFSNILAVCSPTFRMPRAYTNRENDVFFDALIDSIIFCADFLPRPSRFDNFSLSIVKISSIFLINWLSISCSIIFSPKPSMFIANFEQKCWILPLSFAEQLGFRHLVIASFFNFTAG